MLQVFFSKTKKFLITLRISILSIFIVLFVIGMFAVVGITYFRLANAIQVVSLQFMRQVSSTVFDGIVNEIEDVGIETKFSANLIHAGLLDIKNLREVVFYTFNLMSMQAKTLPSVQSAFWGDENGNYVMASRLENQTVASDIIDRSLSAAERKIIFRNLKGITVEHSTEYGLDYDPRVRPWYTDAKQANHFAWTDVYSYRTGLLGISASAPAFDEHGKLIGVFGLNVRLDYLRHFLEKLTVSTHGKVFIANENGEIIAFPHLSQYEGPALSKIHDLQLPWLIKSFDIYKSTHLKSFTFEFNHEKYLAVYQPIPAFTPHVWVVGVVAPQRDFISELLATNLLIILMSLLVLFVGIFLMSMLVTRIVKPLKQLALEAENIKDFKLEDTPVITSRIKEVFYLANAMHAMKNGLRSFQKYVPASLVRNLIETGQDSAIGGEKKNLAIFFSDIQNFTRIADHLDPNLLMENICEYFNELTHIITEREGTIDKYIGDSIMAFWGAPLAVDNCCGQAARAALKCQQRLIELNQMWLQKGRQIFNTRIGLHFGEAVVGNLGSSERLSYSAVGDAINITSRLESVNKIYGTHIIASENFYAQIQNDFIIRKIDKILLKGKDESLNIYELLAEHLEDLSFDYVAYQKEFAQGFAAYEKQNWEEAIRHFRQALTIYINDSVANVFLRRCELFKKFPPRPDWDAVWRLEEK